jgi:hypothetical protein
MKKILLAIGMVLVVSGVCMSMVAFIWFAGSAWFEVGLPLSTGGQCALLLATFALIVSRLIPAHSYKPKAKSEAH